MADDVSAFAKSEGTEYLGTCSSWQVGGTELRGSLDSPAETVQVMPSQRNRAA